MVCCKWLAVGLVAAATTARVAAAPGDPGVAIAGYRPVVDVSDQARIDLDIKAIEGAKTNYAAARKIYKQGANSAKGGGKLTLQSFSTTYASAGRFRQEPLAKMSKAFWGDWDYANRHLLAVLGGKASAKYGLYGSGALAKDPAARTQIIKKVIKFSLVPQYVQHELSKAIYAHSQGEYEEASEHWDEGWAFYAGSQEDGSGNGFSTYILAEKRSSNFGTKQGARSSVNRRFLAAMNRGKGQVGRAGQAGPLLKTTKCIRGLMAVPPIQGCLRYAYRTSSPSTTPESKLAKEAAEAWAFCAAALPGLAAVDGGAARRVRAQTFLGGNRRPQWSIVRAAFGASTLNKMGIRCADVGSLNVEYPAAGHPVCKDGRLSNQVQGTNYC